MAEKLITGAQIRAARSLVRLEQAALASQAGVSVPTIKRMEGSDEQVRGSYENVASVISALEAAGVEFIPENGGGAGVRLRKRSDEVVPGTIPADDLNASNDE